MIELEKEKTCCFTGHRHIAEEDKEGINKRLSEEITNQINEGICYFVTGGALGFDTIAAQQLIKLKKTFKDIKLILALPCRNQERKNGRERI